MRPPSSRPGACRRPESRLLLAAALVAAGLAIPAPAQGNRRLTLDAAASRVWFEANASMGAFRGTARRLSGRAEAPDTLRWTGASGRVEIEVASFGTGISLRNQHLRSHMDVARYPTIVLEVERVVQRPGGAGRDVYLAGRLTVRGVTRQVVIPATILSADPLTLDGRLETRFTDWEMQPPSQLGGLARVRDPLVLRFRAVFRAPPAAIH